MTKNYLLTTSPKFDPSRLSGSDVEREKYRLDLPPTRTPSPGHCQEEVECDHQVHACILVLSSS